ARCRRRRHCAALPDVPRRCWCIAPALASRRTEPSSRQAARVPRKGTSFYVRSRSQAKLDLVQCCARFVNATPHLNPLLDRGGEEQCAACRRSTHSIVFGQPLPFGKGED